MHPTFSPHRWEHTLFQIFWSLDANNVVPQWLLNWAIAYSTPYLVNYGQGYANLQSKIFFIWFGCCFLCIAFVYFFIYETKGLTLEEIDEMYQEVKIASKSTKWAPTSTFRERMSVAGQGGLGPGDKNLSGENVQNNHLEHAAPDGRSNVSSV